MAVKNESSSTPEPILEDLTNEQVNPTDADAVRGGTDKGPFPMVTDGKPTSAQAFWSSGAAIKA